MEKLVTTIPGKSKMTICPRCERPKMDVVGGVCGDCRHAAEEAEVRGERILQIDRGTGFTVYGWD